MTAGIPYDGLGELRAAAARGDLSRLNLGDDRDGVYRHYLSRLPVDVLATGARWLGVEQWDDSLEGQRTLSICGVTWWEGGTELHSQRWGLGVRRDVLPLFESEYPEDMRPRRAMEGLQHWLNHPTADNRETWHAARDAARDAASAASRDTPLYAGRDAAWHAAWYAAKAAARYEARYAAKAAANAAAHFAASRGASWDAVRHAERAAQQRSWLLYTIRKGIELRSTRGTG